MDERNTSVRVVNVWQVDFGGVVGFSIDQSAPGAANPLSPHSWHQQLRSPPAPRDHIVLSLTSPRKSSKGQAFAASNRTTNDGAVPNRGQGTRPDPEDATRRSSTKSVAFWDDSTNADSSVMKEKTNRATEAAPSTSEKSSLIQLAEDLVSGGTSSQSPAS